MGDQTPRHTSRAKAATTVERKVARLSRAALRAFAQMAGSAILVGCTGIIAEPKENGNRDRPPAGDTVGSGGNGSGATGSGATGTAGAGGNGGTGIGSGGSGGTGSGGTGGTSPPAFVPAPATLRRLTLGQYANTVRDLLGANVTLPADLEPDTSLNGFASIGAARTAFSPHAIEQLETAALSLAQQALADPKSRAALVSCTPSAAVDDACARQVVTSLGRRAWRRPLTTEEVNRYTPLATQASTTLNDFWKGLEYAVAGILQSPHFLYREELGTPDSASPSQRVFNGFEIATRLSYFAWSTTPDDQLLDAAAAGTLTTEAGLRAQAERLIASPRAHAATETFFSELLRLADLDDLPQLPNIFPQVSATLGASMRSETLRVLEDMAWNGDGDFRSVFETRTTFVNAELAKLYGLPAPTGTGFVAATLPSSGMRLGLLGQGSFLALNAHADSTSPTRRGKFIREVLLCQGIPPPPPDVDTTLPPNPAGTAGLTMRQRLEKHRTLPACASCHQTMDPIGLGLENFDAVGAFRTSEVGQTIDASGDLDGTAFGDARGLALALKNHPDFSTCLTRSVFRFATGHVETSGEEAAVLALAKDVAANGYRFRSLLLGLAMSPSFRFTGAPE
jgi:hypothetical protein